MVNIGKRIYASKKTTQNTKLLCILHPMNQPSVAVVLLNYNGLKWLQQFVPILVQSTYTNLQIIVADNASTDASVAYLQTTQPQIKIISNPTNQGFAQGYNTALLQVQAQYYVLLNTDVAVTPNWLQPIIQLMESDLTIGACQPKILSYAQPTHFEYAGACGGYIDYLGYPLAKGRVFNTLEKDAGQYNGNHPVFWASGAALVVRSNLYIQLGGFDDYFFAHQEEIDFCWRLQLLGHKVYCCSSSVVYHVGGGTLQAGSPTKTMLNFRNNLIMLHKNLPAVDVKKIIIIRYWLNKIALIPLLLKGDITNAKAILQAHKQYKIWVTTHAAQQNTSHNKTMNTLIGVVNKSIVMQYFILRKKTYTQIV